MYYVYINYDKVLLKKTLFRLIITNVTHSIDLKAAIGVDNLIYRV